MTTQIDRNKVFVLEAFDVLFNVREGEASRTESVSGLPMFGDEFPAEP